MMSGKPGRPQGGLQTLANGLLMVEAIAKRSMRLGEVAAELDLPKQTAYRLLRTLVSSGWLYRNSENIYRPTLKLWSLGQQAFGLDNLKAYIAPIAEELSESHGETVHLAIYDRGRVTYIHKVDGTHPIHSYTQLGGHAPSYCVATGKALLAYQEQEEIDSVIGDGLEQFTLATITSAADLKRELNAVRANACAVNRGEWRDEVGGIAIPLPPSGETPVAALGFSGPIDRILSREVELLAALRGAVAGLSPQQILEPAMGRSNGQRTESRNPKPS